MDGIKTIIIIGCLGMLLICGSPGSVDAYTAEVEYFFQGLNIDTGEVFTDPTVMIIIGGEPGDQIEELLTPPDGFDFGLADVYFEFDPTLGTSLVLTLEGLRNIVGLTINGIEIEIPENLNEFFAVPINNDDIIMLVTAEGKELELTVSLPSTISAPVIISAVSGGPDPGPDPDPAVPEPSTLMLLAGGLLGLLGVRRWKKSGKIEIIGIKRLLLLTAMVGMTGVFALSTAQPVFAQFCSTVTEIPQAECEALIAFYNSTNGDNWSDNTDWLQTTTPCSWYGIDCSAGHVRDIVLNANQLSGALPPEVGNLTNLIVLNLSSNQLSMLPAQIGNLTNLKDLRLEDNQLNSLPTEIGNLINLEIVYLAFNQLSSVPLEIGNLVNLQALHLGTNQLTTLPAEIGNLSNLENLMLWSNQLSILPVEICNLTNLQTLYLESNQLNSLPPEIGNLTNLQVLDLNSNQLSDLPLEFWNLSNLQHLDLGSNQLSSLPAEIGYLVNLQSLHIDRNQLSTLPSEIGNLTNLQVLRSHYTQLSTLPPEIGNLTSLRELRVQNNPFLSTLPSEIGNLTNLQELRLQNNPLLSTLPPEIGNLANLKYLYLTNNTLLSGPLPANLTNLSALEAFHFNNTNLCEPQDAAFQTWLAGISNVQGTGVPCGFCGSVTEIPQTECEALVSLYSTTDGANWSDNTDWLQTTTPCNWYGVGCDAGHVDYINLPNNQLSGSLPPEIGNLTNLRLLLFYDNQLSGSIPSEIGNLTDLEGIELQNNQLSGSIPPEIGNLANLLLLDLQNNQLSGSIPPELGNLGPMVSIALDNNQLSGNIPPELGNLTVGSLGMSNNQLSGSIPPELGNLTVSSGLFLNDNPLSGPLPANLLNLVPITIWFNNTNVCEPQDAAFQTWLAGVPATQRTGIPCGGFCDNVGEIPRTECEALVALYNSTDGDNWSDNTDWLQTTTPCTWYGVGCDAGHVDYIDLPNNQLNGSIPPEIGNLINLQFIYLISNQLTTLPTEIGNLTNLQALYLDFNQLSDLPAEIGNLTNLLDLDLQYNQLSILPAEIGNLPNLRSLILDGNQLNSLLSEIGNLKNLQELTLENNTQLSGSLPANLTNLTALNSFLFNNTNLCEPQDITFQTWLTGIPVLQSTGVACASFDYFAYDEYGGSAQDVDKTPQPDDDEQMCWNFSGSNILHWAGWNVFDTAQDISENVKSYWTNAGGMMKYLWRWWMQGTEPPDLGEGWSTLIAAGGGNHWESYDFSDYYYSHWHKNVMSAVKDYLHNGYGVSLRIYDNEDNQDAGHALTVWGYQYTDDGTVLGLWITDSDDAESEPPEMRLLPVTYTAKWIDSTLYELKWRVADDAQAGSYRNWLIEGVQALKSRDPSVVQVHKAGTGAGTVVSTPAGIICGDDCVSPYPPGTQVTLTAAPENEAVFVGWQGACSGTGDCVMTVDGEQTVTALFESTESTAFTITTDVEAGVSLYPTGTVHEVPAGVDAKFVFTPDAEHNILDVLVDGYSVGPVTAYTFTNVAADHALHVKTMPKDAKLAITRKKCIDIDADGNVLYDENGEEKEIACTPGDNATIYVGDQACDSECMQMIVPFTDGTAIILRAVPDENNRFLRWEINGEPVDPEDEDKIRYTLEDLFLGPVIGCCSHC